MPGVGEAAPRPLDGNLHYSVQTLDEQGKPTAAGGAGDKVFTLGRKTEGGEDQVLAQLVFSHSPSKPSPMTISEMMLQLSNMTATLQGETVKIAEGMIDHSKKMIEKKSEQRIEMFEKVQRMQDRIEKKQKAAEAWGWVGAIASVAITAATMGSMGPIAAACMIAGAGIGLGNQIATSAGLYEHLAKKDPDAGKALNYSMFALQIALSLGSIGAGAAKSLTSSVDDGAKLATDAAKGAGNTAKLANAGGDAAVVASKTGTAMSGASSGSQMADELVDGVSKTVQALNKGQQVADDAVDAGQLAGQAGANQAAGTGSNATGGVSKNANLAKNMDDAQEIAKYGKIENALSRGGHAAQGVVGTQKMINDIDIAVLSGNVLDNRATLTNVQKTMQFQQSVMQEIVGGLGDMVERVQGSSRLAIEVGSKLYASKIAVASNMGPTASQAS